MEYPGHSLLNYIGAEIGRKSSDKMFADEKRKLAILLLIIGQAAFAETVEVFREVDVDPRSVNGLKIEEDDPATWPKTFGAKLGVVDTGDETISKIIKEYEEQSWQGEPFYGPCETYIFKDMHGEFYSVHFEFKKGHKIFGKGVRFAITKLSPVEGAKNIFIGSPYNGSSVFDEKILNQLKTIALTKPRAEQDGADQAATAPESKPEDNQNLTPESKGLPQ